MELEFYLTILNEFEKNKGNKKKTIKALTKQMIKTSCVRDKKILKNALIILIALLEDNGPDIFSTRGSNTTELSNREKRKFVSTLLKEYLSKKANNVK